MKQPKYTNKYGSPTRIKPATKLKLDAIKEVSKKPRLELMDEAIDLLTVKYNIKPTSQE